MNHFVSKSCKGELCPCGRDATHKVSEEIMSDDPNQMRHPLTAYVCCSHFYEIMGFGARACKAPPIPEELRDEFRSTMYSAGHDPVRLPDNDRMLREILRLRAALTTPERTALATVQAERKIAEDRYREVTEELAEVLRALESVGIGSSEGEWYYTSDDGEQPCDTIAEAVQKAMALVDRDALNQRDAVTKELSEKTTEFSDSLAAVTKELEEAKWEIVNSAQHQRDELAALQQQLATARSDVLREVREKVEKMPEYDPRLGDLLVDRDAVLAILGGEG